MEAVVFIAGVGLGLPATSFPIAVLTGLLCGIVIGFIIYKGGNKFALQIFLIISTCFLYLVAAGLFSKSVWDFEMHKVSGYSVAQLVLLLIQSVSGTKSSEAMLLRLAVALDPMISERAFGMSM